MDDAEVAKIRVKMARIRSRAQTKAVRLGEETKRFLDWKHYVRLFPWGVVGTAALVGFLLVPARRKLPAGQPVRPQAPPPPQATRPASPGLLSAITGIAMKSAMRMAVTYAGHFLGQYLASLQSPSASDLSKEFASDDLYHVTR